MLNKRGNILFSDEIWQTLEYLSREKGESISELIRQAVEKIYVQDAILEKRRKAWEEIKRIRPHFKGKIDYKALINYGRER